MKKLIYLLFIVGAFMTNCSSMSIPLKDEFGDRSKIIGFEPIRQRNENNNSTVSSSSSLYLPLITRNYPLISIFGVQSILGRSDFEKIETLEVNWLRGLTVFWCEIQPDEKSYDSSKYDWSKAKELEKKLSEAYEKGLTVILTVECSPDWARKYPNRYSPIKENAIDDFSAFMKEVVKRYSVAPYYVKYYQIFNEPDAPVSSTVDGFGGWGEWGEQVDSFFGGEYYGKVLSEAYKAVKSDYPSVNIITAGFLLDCDPRETGDGYCPDENAAKQWNFFEGVLKKASDSFDYVAFHTYAYYSETGIQNSPVWKERNRDKWFANGGVVDGKIDYIREKMSNYQVNKPLLITEAALLYGDAPFSDDNTRQHYEDQKADYIVWVYANAWSKGVKGVTWYALEGWRKSELIREGNELPAYQALKTMTGYLKNADFLSREDDNDGFTKFVFRNGGETIWLMIPTGQEYGKTYTIGKPSNLKKVVNLFGEEQVVSGSTISFTRPVYVFLTP